MDEMKDVPRQILLLIQIHNDSLKLVERLVLEIYGSHGQSLPEMQFTVDFDSVQ
jgi:hypothetical protein